MQLSQTTFSEGKHEHTCKALVVSCIDFRLQRYLREFEDENIGEGEYDLLTFAGGVKDIKIVLKEVDISKRLHHICELYLINHQDCGAYGEVGTFERHKNDLIKARQKINNNYPDLNIYCYYLHLDGKFEMIKNSSTG